MNRKGGSGRVVGRAGLILFALMALTAFLAPVVAPYDPYAVSGAAYLPPGAEHLLGTNDIGQDIFSELLYGARTSLAVGLLSAAISLGLGTAAGVLAGWYGGAADRLVMKVTAFFLTIPFIPAVILLSAFTRPGIVSTAAILGGMSWAGTARVVRTQTRAIRERDYIRTIRAMGAPDFYIFTRHVIRELSPWLMYQGAGRVKSGILSEASLSFLGLGSAAQKSWGSMIYYAQAKSALLTGAWVWWIIPPGLGIVLVSCALVMISYGAEERTDERLGGEGK